MIALRGRHTTTLFTIVQVGLCFVLLGCTTICTLACSHEHSSRQGQREDMETLIPFCITRGEVSARRKSARGIFIFYSVTPTSPAFQEVKGKDTWMLQYVQCSRPEWVSGASHRKHLQRCLSC